MEKNELSNLIIRKICAINKINLPCGGPLGRQNREQSAFAYKSKGETVYQSGGQTVVSDSEHIVLLPKGSTYSLVCKEEGECLMIEFEAENMNETLTSYDVSSPSEMTNIISRLEHFWTFKKPAYKIKCMAGIYEVIAKLEDSRTNLYQLSSKYNIIKSAVKYLEENYSDPSITTEKLSAIAGISEVYFRKIFTEIYHIPPMKYIRGIRIQKAKDMLIGDYTSITFISEAVGINGIYQFSKLFKNETGLSPSEFARMRSDK